MPPRPRDDPTAAQLTISQLAARTGIAAGTLRVWQSRHGFPQPARASGGHRRYDERTVEQLLDVIELRHQGLGLPTAITRALSAPSATPASLFAGLRERRPELQPFSIRKAALLALSRAIEDEHCSRGTIAVLVGSFQRARFYRQSERRWRDLARSAQLAVALADFQRLRSPRTAPHEVPVSRAQPLAREWALIVSTPTSCACLAAWEVPSARSPSDGDRRFEALWSPEPDVVSSALHVAAEIVSGPAPALADRLRARTQEQPLAGSRDLRAVASLSHRMIAYLSAVQGREREVGAGSERRHRPAPSARRAKR